MSEEQSRVGRPPSLTPRRRQTLLDLVRGGMSITRSASLVGTARRTVHRHAANDPAFREAVTDALEEGRTNKEASLMAVEIDDPEVRLKQLESELQHAALDAEENKPGAAARARGLQEAIAETRHLLERREYAAKEKERRAIEAAERARDKEIDRLKSEGKDLERAKLKAYSDIESALDLVIAAVRHGVEISAEQANAAHRLRRLLGDQTSISDSAWVVGPIANRVLYRLRFEAMLTDVRSFPGLGEKPLA